MLTLERVKAILAEYEKESAVENGVITEYDGQSLSDAPPLKALTKEQSASSKIQSKLYSERRLKKVEGDNWIYDTDAAKLTGLTLNELRQNALSISISADESAQSVIADKNSDTGELESFRLKPSAVNVIVDKVQRKLDKLHNSIAFSILRAWKAEGAKKFAEEPAPPNCYDTEGLTKCYFGIVHYSQVYYCTRLPVEIRQVEKNCKKCAYAPKGNLTLETARNYKSSCDNCEELNGYYLWCYHRVFNVLATTALLSAGISLYIDILKIGYDEETKEIIIPLTREKFVAVKLNNGGSNSNFDYDNISQAKRIFSHFNLQPNQASKHSLVRNDEGAVEYHGCNYAKPYLDNRFYGLNGEVVIAEILGSKKYVNPLPFETWTQ